MWLQQGYLCSGHSTYPSQGSCPKNQIQHLWSPNFIYFYISKLQMLAVVQNYLYSTFPVSWFWCDSEGWHSATFSAAITDVQLYANESRIGFHISSVDSEIENTEKHTHLQRHFRLYRLCCLNMHIEEGLKSVTLLMHKISRCIYWGIRALLIVRVKQTQQSKFVTDYV